MPIRILIVDDEPDIQFLLTRRFRKEIKDEKIELDFSLDGISAYNKIISENSFDIVLSDINMPKMDGLTLLTKVRDFNPFIKFIIMSAYSDMKNIRLAMNKGAFDFIVKPFDFDDLEKTIEKTVIEIKNLKTSLNTKNENLKIKKQIIDITNISQMISSILDFDSFLEEILDKIIELTCADNGAIFFNEPEQNEIVCKISRDKFKNSIIPNLDKSSVYEVFNTNNPDFIVTKSHVFKNGKETKELSLICAPLKFEDKLLGVLYLDGQGKNTLFAEENLSLLKIFITQASISIVNANKNAIIRKQFQDSLKILYSVIATISSRVYEYARNTERFSNLLCNALGLSSYETERIRIASLVHDLSIIGSMEQYFYGFKPPGDREKQIIEKHPFKTVEIIEHLDGIDDIKKIILEHHERYDGTGYPFNKKKEEICLGARILKIIDDFTFLLTMRRFQDNDRKEKIINELLNNKGSVYDPEIVDVFIELIQKENLIQVVDENDIYFLSTNEYFLWKIPSNVNFESIVLARIMKEINKKDIDEDVSYFIDFSIGEVIRNAIVHGNKYNQEKFVTIRLSFNDIDEKNSVLNIKIIDQGEWTDFDKHNRFTRTREEIFSLLNGFETFKSKNELLNDEFYQLLLCKLRKFVEVNYVDYNAYLDIEHPEISGGIGLFQVKKIFDQVEFYNTIENGIISGTEVILKKKLEVGLTKKN